MLVLTKRSQEKREHKHRPSVICRNIKTENPGPKTSVFTLHVNALSTVIAIQRFAYKSHILKVQKVC